MVASVAIFVWLGFALYEPPQPPPFDSACCSFLYDLHDVSMMRTVNKTIDAKEGMSLSALWQNPDISLDTSETPILAYNIISPSPDYCNLASLKIQASQDFWDQYEYWRLYFINDMETSIGDLITNDHSYTGDKLLATLEFEFHSFVLTPESKHNVLLLAGKRKEGQGSVNFKITVPDNGLSAVLQKDNQTITASKGATIDLGAPPPDNPTQ